MLTSLRQLGYKGDEKDLAALDQQNLEPARIIIEHRDRYTIQSASGTMMGEITGHLRYTAQSRLDLPAVGDWVGIMPVDASLAIIHQVLPRTSLLQRLAVGSQAEGQIIAANVDTAFIVQSVGHDFNLNRLERYLSLCHQGKIHPIIVITKVDLVEEATKQELAESIRQRVPSVPCLLLSCFTDEGINALREIVQPGNTYCFLGSSGVGKSTLINRLMGHEALKTQTISAQTGKGRHTTTERQLFLLPEGGIVIDTPGMREVGLTDDASGLEQTFTAIYQLAEQCRFNDCTHMHEAGCAVRQAIDDGSLSEDAFDHYVKLQREQQRLVQTIAEQRKKDKKQGKMYKSIMRERKKRKL